MQSTASYEAGDLVLITSPYTGGTQAGNRPALVTLDTGNGDVVVARVTTPMYQTLYDVSIIDWQGAGLPALSVVRLHQLATLEKGLIRRRLGRLQPEDRQRVSAMMPRIYGTWCRFKLLK